MVSTQRFKHWNQLCFTACSDSTAAREWFLVCGARVWEAALHQQNLLNQLLTQNFGWRLIPRGSIQKCTKHSCRFHPAQHSVSGQLQASAWKQEPSCPVERIRFYCHVIGRKAGSLDTAGWPAGSCYPRPALHRKSLRSITRRKAYIVKYVPRVDVNKYGSWLMRNSFQSLDKKGTNTWCKTYVLTRNANTTGKYLDS